MAERTSIIFGALIFLGVVSAPLVPALATSVQQDPQTTDAKSPAELKAEDAFTRNCVKCHPVDRIAGSRRTRSQWEEVMTTMQTARGAVITDEDWDIIQTYLVKHYGRVNVNRAETSELVAVLGMTESDAGRVVSHRKSHGAFPDFEALVKVPQVDVERLKAQRNAIVF